MVGLVPLAVWGLVEQEAVELHLLEQGLVLQDWGTWALEESDPAEQGQVGQGMEGPE